MALLRFSGFSATLLLSAFSPLLFAQQFVPESDDFIVEKLSAAIVSLSRELAGNREQSAPVFNASTLSATELSNIEQQAVAAFRIAVSSQEQRAYGYTVAVLERWPETQEMSVTMHILWAAVLQHEHSFDDALTHLDAAIRKDANNAQAWLMRAQINLVIADYNAAQKSCDVLGKIARTAVSVNCSAQVDALTGNAQRGLGLVENMLQNSRDLSRQDYAELFTSAAGFAHRLGMTEQAQRYYQNSLQIVPNQAYVLVHYGQLLLEQSRYNALIALFARLDERALSNEQKILYTRALSISENPLDIEHANSLQSSLQKSFESAFRREEAFPNKAFAQFCLFIRDEPEKALSAARANWALQKEPSDTLLLALAAEANGDKTILTELAQWAETHGSEDTRLDRIFKDNEVT